MNKEEILEMDNWILRYFPDRFNDPIEERHELWKYWKDLDVIAKNHIGIQFTQR